MSLVRCGTCFMHTRSPPFRLVLGRVFNLLLCISGMLLLPLAATLNNIDFWFIRWGFDLLFDSETFVVICDWNLFSYFHWWKQTVLYRWAGISISGICFRWTLHFGVAGSCFSLVLHMDVAFAVWLNVLHQLHVVGEESFVGLCVYVWCHSKGWRNLVVPEGFPLLCLLGFECFDTLPRMMKVPTESL